MGDPVLVRDLADQCGFADICSVAERFIVALDADGVRDDVVSALIQFRSSVGVLLNYDGDTGDADIIPLLNACITIALMVRPWCRAHADELSHTTRDCADELDKVSSLMVMMYRT